jgi:hypothetical protein
MSVTIFLLESSVCTYVFLDGGDGLAEIGVLAWEKHFDCDKGWIEVGSERLLVVTKRSIGQGGCGVRGVPDGYDDGRRKRDSWGGWYRVLMRMKVSSSKVLSNCGWVDTILLSMNLTCFNASGVVWIYIKQSAMRNEWSE